MDLRVKKWKTFEVSKLRRGSCDQRQFGIVRIPSPAKGEEEPTDIPAHDFRANRGKKRAGAFSKCGTLPFGRAHGAGNSSIISAAVRLIKLNKYSAGDRLKI